jgi:transposase
MAEKQERRERRSYTESFKKQMVELYNNGKPRAEIVREYDITGSSFDLWLKRTNASGSSYEKDN